MKPAKPVIFLDIDGVMNCNQHFKGQQGDAWWDRSVRALNAIIKGLAPVDLVISSSWRYYFNDDEMTEILKRNGVVGAKIIGHTAIRFTEQPRGHCIREWLQDHPRRKHFVILDDSPEVTGPDLEPHHIMTTWETGLGHEHVPPAIRIVRNQQGKPTDVYCECGGGMTGCAECFGAGFRPAKNLKE